MHSGGAQRFSSRCRWDTLSVCKHFIQFVVLHPDFCLSLVFLSLPAIVLSAAVLSARVLTLSQMGENKRGEDMGKGKFSWGTSKWLRLAELALGGGVGWGGWLICSSHAGCDQTDYLMQSHETFSPPSIRWTGRRRILIGGEPWREQVSSACVACSASSCLTVWPPHSPRVLPFLSPWQTKVSCIQSQTQNVIIMQRDADWWDLMKQAARPDLISEFLSGIRIIFLISLLF